MSEPRYYTVDVAGAESGPLDHDQANALYLATPGAVMLAWY